MVDYIEDEDDFDLKILDGISSRDMIDFLDNPVWRAIQKDLARRLFHADEMLEVAPIEDAYDRDKEGNIMLAAPGIRKLQGACYEIRYLLELPQALKDRITEREEDARTSGNTSTSD
jgi:hypothetical protein